MQLYLIHHCKNIFIYLRFYVACNTVHVISRWVVGRAEETSIYSSSGFCTVHCRPTASNYQLSHLRPCRKLNPGLRGGRRECYYSATVAPSNNITLWFKNYLNLPDLIIHPNSPLNARSKVSTLVVFSYLSFYSIHLLKP